MLRTLARVPRSCIVAANKNQACVGVVAGRAPKASGWKKGGKKKTHDEGRVDLYELYLRCVEPAPRTM